MKLELYAVLGWINVVLVTISLSYFFVKLFFKKYKFKTKESKIKFAQAIKKISKYHKINGVLILIVALIHAYLILGTVFYWHTGLVLFLAILLNLLIYLLGKIKLLKKWLLFHKYTAILIFIFLIIHLTNPWLFG